MNSHTPGPWEVTGENGYLNQCGIGRRTAHGFDPIAAAYGAGNELEANARLIAAAPDMLAALEHVRASAQTGTYDGGVVISFAAFEAVRAVLIERGGTP